MQKLLLFSITLLALISCKDSSKYQLQKSDLMNKSFLVVNVISDTIEIEFTDNCVKTYTWDYFTYESWDVMTKNDSSILFFDGKYFILSEKTEHGFAFINLEDESVFFELIEVLERVVNINDINGKWIENDHMQRPPSDELPAPPPCYLEGLDTVYIPSFEFKTDSCLITKYCDQKLESIRVNEHFGIIEFGGFCTSKHQWRIEYLKKDSMLVDVRYVEQHEVKYSENQRLIKQ